MESNRPPAPGAGHGCTLQLLAHRRRFERLDSRCKPGSHRLFGSRWFGFCFNPVGYVEALVDIDPDLGDAAVADAADVLGICQGELAAPERMFHP